MPAFPPPHVPGAQEEVETLGPLENGVMETNQGSWVSWKLLREDGGQDR